MADEKGSGGTSGRKDGFWQRIWRQPSNRWLLGIPLGGALALILGVALTGGFLASLHATTSNAFCTSCHSMNAFTKPEYEQSSHFKNAAGVRASCADCHVPESFIPKMQRKIQAGLHEVPGWIMGTIDTREEYEANRARMAELVWERFRGNDSLTCRNCHSYEAMDSEKQGRYAQRRHSAEYLERSGRTCIDCHQGLAHELPDS